MAAVGSLSIVHTLLPAFSQTGEKHFLCPLVQNKIRRDEKLVVGARKHDRDTTVVLSSLADRQGQQGLLCWS